MFPNTKHTCRLSRTEAREGLKKSAQATNRPGTYLHQTPSGAFFLSTCRWYRSTGLSAVLQFSVVATETLHPMPPPNTAVEPKVRRTNSVANPTNPGAQQRRNATKPAPTLRNTPRENTSATLHFTYPGNFVILSSIAQHHNTTCKYRKWFIGRTSSTLAPFRLSATPLPRKYRVREIVQLDLRYALSEN